MTTALVSRDKILQLLGSGLNAETVALAVGCDASYISQLLADEAFKEEVQLLRLSNLTAASQRDKEYDAIEDTLLAKLKDSIDFITRPRDILTALAVINKAERRGAAPAESAIVNNAIINLSIPTRVQLAFTVNTDKQVVAVNGESMVTLDSKKLPELLAQQQQTRVEEVPKPQIERKSSDETDGVTKRSLALLRGGKTSSDISDADLLKQLGGA